jgi:hypothetical protein
MREGSWPLFRTMTCSHQRDKDNEGLVAMTEKLRGAQAEDGGAVSAVDIPKAVTAGRLVYSDGASQVFTIDGRTTYSEQGGDSAGEWYVDDDGRFCSFWPPSYRACYALRWLVEGPRIVGLRFTGLTDGVMFEGRYEWFRNEP